jgi:hypothetical protein
MLGVIVLLQIRQLNIWFFDVVYRINDALLSTTIQGFRLSDIGHTFFRFWAKPPY